MSYGFFLKKKKTLNQMCWKGLNNRSMKRMVHIITCVPYCPWRRSPPSPNCMLLERETKRNHKS